MTGRLAILGGCGGIGRVLVTEARGAGFEPVVLDLGQSIERHTPDAPAIAVDTTDADSLARAAKEMGEVRGFVTLAGFMSDAAPVADTDPAIWDEVLRGNLTGSFLALRAFAPCVAEGGAMVLTGSGLGHNVRPGYGPYAVAKAGIAALTRQCALELAPAIRVNCVAPSAVDTAFLRGGTGRSDESGTPRIDIAAYSAAIPLGRIAEPADITGPILFLLSDAAGYMTGQVLHVNGGVFMP